MAASSTTQATEASDVETHLKHEPPKRNKTWGEHVFNWITYAGFALLGNEASSLVITHQAENSKLTKNLYKEGIDWAAKFKESKYVPKYVSHGELQGLLTAVIGGMLMVPFVKAMEDHKGRIVRKFDRAHYGSLSDSDPTLVEAHKEMDDAPKQTWGSLWKGRLLTVAAAIGLDTAIGWDHAASTKLFKEGSTASQYSSLNRIAQKTADGTVNGLKHFGVTFAKEGSEVATKYWVKKATWLLTLSSTLTVLFYASSKLFAKKSEEKIEHKQDLLLARAHGTHADGTEDALEAASVEQTEAKSTTETPTLQVKNVRREETVAATAQLAQGA